MGETTSMADGAGYWRALRVISPLLRWYFTFSVQGREHVPQDGPCILAANHASYFDPIALAMASPRPVRFIMDRGYYERRSIHWVCRGTGAIPVENDPRDFGSLRRALLALRQGAVLGIFPEGGRSDDASLKPGRPGSALLALRATVPLVPAGISGTFAAFSRHHRLPRRSPVSVRFGEPIRFPPQWRDNATKDHLEKATTILMERLLALSS